MIRKLLIANRGEIASRVIRSCRALDIATVAVFSEPDADAPYVTEADVAVALPGATAEETYLRSEAIIAAALAAGADAVHPGYGFLSENAAFASACADAGLTFVGPPPAAIRAMGSKTSAKELMAAAGVPVLPGVTVGDGARPPADLAELASASIGFPVLVKAAFGGGGRGMRAVHSPDGLLEAVAGAQREARSAFGDGTVFLERLVQRPRHIEVQIFADQFGQVTHLFERECSIQRRYQKIIEEAPSPAVSESLRAELGAAAVAAGKAIGYVGAGTVEFILDESGEFFFLEVNTRLQVEHPVTEMVTGLDLVALQVLVAEGQPLPPSATGARLSGHAIEARLYAEDAAAGYLPSTGPVHRFDIPALPGIRVDAGVRSGGQVSMYYDPMLAKVIAYAPTRQQAARLLGRALAESRLHGVVTNRDLLVGIFREPEFLDGQIDTGYLDRHSPASLMTADPRRDEVHAIAVALADQAQRRLAAPVLAAVPTGWRNVPNGPQQVTYLKSGPGDEPLVVSYRLAATEAEVTVGGGAPRPVRLHSCAPGRVDLTIDGLRRVVHVERDGPVRYADSSLGASTLTERPRFPLPDSEVAAGSLVAPMPGTVVRVEAAGGDAVTAGQVLVVLEAMKMEHSVRSPHDGTVAEVRVSTGQAVNSGTVLVVLDSPDLSQEPPSA
ncbi:MAG TPA: biotin carboxylase N-terminal domain-containing protein [Trebonia sp.]|nr:biotin carboxylase N-terminal domain-containing protein [Trebonia sp.]